MKCPKCGTDNPETRKFCRECGFKLLLVCPECKTENLPEDKYCGECGHDLTQAKGAQTIDYQQPRSYTPNFIAEKILTSRSAIEGERKIVTVLFADVAGFTSMSEKLDPEEVHQIMDGCFKILMDEIHKFEGTINQFTGDGVMALFGAPLAHEDHAQRACHASLAIQKALVEYSEKLKKERGIDFKMRIGLNSGPVIVGSVGDDLRMDYTAVGDTVNLASRMESNSTPGNVLVSANTYRLARDYFEFRSLGEIQVKGKEDPQEAYELVEPSDVETRIEASVARGLKELVGRDDPLETLFRAFGKAKRGEAQVVDVVGEAGIGKSRLVYEFEKALGDEARFLTGVCAHYGNKINFLPVMELVRAAFGIEEGMTQEEAGNQITQKAGDGLGSMIPFYRNLLSLPVDDPMFKMLDAEGRKFGTFEAVKNLLLTISTEKPLVVLLEDVHWIDKISEDLFMFFSRCILEHPILMVAAYRPEASPPWAQGAHYHRLGLETLSAKASIRLVRNMVGGLPLDSDLEQKIVARTGGNPFFVEEIVRELLDRGDIVKIDDRYVCNKPIDQLQIPDTIQGVLSARMDRLNEDLKQTMQVASVIGRDFAFRILKSIMALGDELRVSLSNLVGLEILYEKKLYPELEYIFKHALTQEVAYESLLKQRRHEIHGRIAQTIEELYADRLEEHYEMLAYHYERSGQVSEAVNYLSLSGEKSNRHNASELALEFFRKALDLVEVNQVELNPELEVKLLQGKARASLNVGDVGTGDESLRQAINLSRRHSMKDYERKCLRQYATASSLFPAKRETEEMLKMGMERARELGDITLETTILGCRALFETLAGHFETAHKMIQDVEQRAVESGKPRLILMTRLLSAGPRRYLEEPQKSIDLTEGMVETTRNMFSLANFSLLTLIRGVALGEIGRIQDSISVLTSGIELCEKFGALLRVSALYNSLGYCYSEIGQPERAWDMNLKSEQMARQMMDRFPKGRRLYAEIYSQATVNLMENLFDQGKTDKAYNRMQLLKEESKSEGYDINRLIWESRMHYLEAQILLHRNDLGGAEALIKDNLEVKRLPLRKRRGGFLRLLGETQAKRGEFDSAVSSFNEAIMILKEVGNPRQLWQAHSSAASAYDKMGKAAEANEQWSAAAATIQGLAEGLSEREMREGLLNAEPIRKILSKAEA